MFSPELENLIKATLVDGVLEEHEKMALVKRAQAEGVDITELEIYINSLLQQRKMDLDAQSATRREEKQKEKKAQMGRTCPNCGEIVPDTMLVCPVCKHEFRSGTGKAAVAELADKIQALTMKAGAVGSPEYQTIQNAIIDTITTFPVPNTKSDILDFITLAGPYSQKHKFQQDDKLITKIISVPIAIVLGFFGGCSGMLTTMGIFDGTDFEEDSVGWSFAVFFILFGVIVWWYTSKRGKSTVANPEDIVWNARADAWGAKLNQVILKARMLKGDEQFSQQIEEIAKKYNIQ